MSKGRQQSARQPAVSAKSRKEALRGSSGVKQRKPPPAASVLEKGRAGSRGVVIYLNPVAKEALAALAREQRKSLQRLGIEAFNHLFLSYGGKPIA